MKAAARVFMSFLVLVAGGCAGRPVFSVEVLKTPTPASLDSAASPVVSSPLPTLTFTPDAPEPTDSAVDLILPADFSPVLYGQTFDSNTFFLLLGGVLGEMWVSPEQAAAYLTGEAIYDVHTLAGDLYQVQGSRVNFSPAFQSYSITTGVTLDEPGMVGVVQGWPVAKRPVQELSPDQEVYRQAVLDWLTTRGITATQAGEIEVSRTDLEGDGVDEIFISATHLDESQHTTRSGDYSVVLMRKVVGNEAATILIQGEVYHSQEPEITYPRTYSLGNFLDLDRDGVLEIIVEYQAWEDAGALIYQIDGLSVTRVL